MVASNLGRYGSARKTGRTLSLEGAFDLSAVNHQPAFLLWVDAVGTFLICPGESVVIGQAEAARWIDIALLADISRKHAVIARHGEGYTVEPLGEAEVRVGASTGKSFLAAGDTLGLGSQVELAFSRPHPLSASAKLVVSSGHRTQPRTNGIVLMAESCVLGPAASSHIVCPHWTEEVVLFAQGDALFCRSQCDLMIDGQPAGGRGELTLASRVECGDMSFSVEAV